MKNDNHESQVDTLYKYLRKTRRKVDRVFAWKLFGIADVRSRVCNIQDKYCICLERERVPGKRYLRYWIKN